MGTVTRIRACVQGARILPTNLYEVISRQSERTRDGTRQAPPSQKYSRNSLEGGSSYHLDDYLTKERQFRLTKCGLWRFARLNT